jgi:hypothetical protein
MIRGISAVPGRDPPHWAAPVLRTIAFFRTVGLEIGRIKHQALESPLCRNSFRN